MLCNQRTFVQQERCAVSFIIMEGRNLILFKTGICLLKSFCIVIQEVPSTYPLVDVHIEYVMNPLIL